LKFNLLFVILARNDLELLLRSESDPKQP